MSKAATILGRSPVLPTNDQNSHPLSLPLLKGRPCVKSKFLFADGKKLYARGVTYGTFRPNQEGQEYRAPPLVDRDFDCMVSNGINTIRTYTVPPGWLLDAAQKHGLRVMVGLPWEQHVTFLDSKKVAASIEARVGAGVRACAGHPAILCYAVGNEIPSQIVRWHGPRRVKEFIKRLYRIAKAEDPAGLVTYVNYPTTEYLELPFLDLVCFNVYLEARDNFEAYLARLQNLAGDRPLLLAELGLDSRRHGKESQASVLDWQVRTAFASGCAGAFVFAWSDEWYRGGCEITDWEFGLMDRENQPKPALKTVRKAFAEAPFPSARPWPHISVVVCSYNGGRTIRDCLEGLSKLEYPNYEVIVVDDGSTDATAGIAREYKCRVISTSNCGLSSARNTGMKAANGEIIAYIDDDAYPDPNWLTYLADIFLKTNYAGLGGPNIAPPEDGFIARGVAYAPGGPVHVLLSDQEAEHIPGCNMAFRKAALEAVGGFDPQFRTAGDDVDICWQLQQQGLKLGFCPAALVWHHRRNSVRAYWKQQKGYGRAEALLEKKWPEKYNELGHLSWSGRVYDKTLSHVLFRSRARIYHGTWGSAAFQSVYQPATNTLWSLVLMPEWYLIIFVLTLPAALGLLWNPMLLGLPLLALAAALPMVQATVAAAKVSFADDAEGRLGRLRLFSLVALLHLVQPLARLWGRLDHGLSPWRFAFRTISFPWPQTVSVWSEQWAGAEDRLHQIETILRTFAAKVSRGGDFDRWDMEVRGGLFGGSRIRMAIEEHGRGKQLIRIRLWPVCSTRATVLVLVFTLLSLWSSVDQAHITARILAGITLILIIRLFLECAATVGMSHKVLRMTEAGLQSDKLCRPENVSGGNQRSPHPKDKKHVLNVEECQEPGD